MALPLAIAAGLSFVIVPLVVKVLLALGVGFVTYTGADYLVTLATNFFAAQFAGLPSAVIQILYILGFHQGMSMIFAAWTALVTLKAAMGVFTKMRIGFFG